MIISAKSQAAAEVGSWETVWIAADGAARPRARTAVAASAPSTRTFVEVRTICARGPVRRPATFKIPARTRADAAAVRSQPEAPVALARYSAKTSAIAAIEAGYVTKIAAHPPTNAMAGPDASRLKTEKPPFD